MDKLFISFIKIFAEKYQTAIARIILKPNITLSNIPSKVRKFNFLDYPSLMFKYVNFTIT